LRLAALIVEPLEGCCKGWRAASGQWLRLRIVLIRIRGNFPGVVTGGPADLAEQFTHEVALDLLFTASISALGTEVEAAHEGFVLVE
jgi:hypothetical protein